MLRPALLECHGKVPGARLVFNCTSFCKIYILTALPDLGLIAALRRLFMEIHALKLLVAIESRAIFFAGRSAAVQHCGLGALKRVLLVGHRGRIRGVLVCEAALILLVL